MNEYPQNQEINNSQLVEFACERINFSDKQKEKLTSLLSEELKFRERLIRAYKIFYKPEAKEGDRRSADLLLENIRDDITTILELE